MTREIQERIAQVRRGEVPDGYRETMLGLVPVGWNSQRVNEICVISSGSTPRRNHSDYFTGDILWVTSGELKSKYITDTQEKITDSAVKASGLALYEPGTVVIAMYGLEAAGVRGTASIIARKSTISQACMAFTHFQNVDHEFFYYWYLNHGQMIGSRYAQGTKQQNLSVDIVGAFPVCFPELREQQKIAAILSAQDKIIELKERLLTEKRRQKKYLMQQLLTGKQRLPGFSGEWKISRFGDIFQFIPNNTCSRDFMTVSGGEIRNVHYGDVLIKYHSIIDCNTSALPFLTGNARMNPTMFLKSGDIIIADTAEDLTTGKAVEITNIGNNKVVSGLHTMACRPLKNLFAPKWLGYYMSSDAYHNQLIPLICGTKVSSISKREIVNTTIAAPPMDEQRAIAEILSAADREIELLQQSLEQEKRRKKALSQLLLTGIVRVNDAPFPADGCPAQNLLDRTPEKRIIMKNA